MRALVVHGGAGAAPSLGARRQNDAAAAALALGWDILAGGGSALDAVVSAIVHLENDPSLNAGVGACLTSAGTVELDASVMEGTQLRAGAVALITRMRNPVLLARALLEHGPHVFMAGPAAEEEARRRGLPLVEPHTLVTDERRRQFEARQTAARPDAAHGTVGAVALDARGHVAAATSTGGVTGKRPGRIGDSPLVGAGTFADDAAGAASATGTGEAIIRSVLTHTVVEQLRRGDEPSRAAAHALARLTGLGSDGGVIVVDRFGRTAAAHTTPHMIWATRSG